MKHILFVTMLLGSFFSSQAAWVCYNGGDCFGSRLGCDYFYSHGCNQGCSCVEAISLDPKTDQHIKDKTPLILIKGQSVVAKLGERSYTLIQEDEPIVENEVFQIEYVDSLKLFVIKFFDARKLSEGSSKENCLIRQIKISA